MEEELKKAGFVLFDTVHTLTTRSGAVIKVSLLFNTWMLTIHEPDKPVPILRGIKRPEELKEILEKY